MPHSSKLSTPDLTAAAHGRNEPTTAARPELLATRREVAAEPMFLLLLAACAVYSGLGEGAGAIALGPC
ncbi:hypothetical protein [Hymenobacter nivis]|uniref:Uncharacterized protein n=1 Tax=Hymenobacter nivis TaxID=1850093 RepID=A0A2Z3GIK1_9BACT|nr:hypothetical protein [Hymenobacter nivis]AWM31712.1 hypothetical protein DDQ68_02255 [Hymenobacter nivis]